MCSATAVESGPATGVRLLQTLDSLPRPPFGSVVGWGAFWTMPELARRQMAKIGERVVIDIPMMPTILFTSSVEDAHAVFMEHDGAMEFNEGLRRLAPHERLFGSDLIDALGGELHDKVRRLVMPAFKGNAIRGYEEAMVEATRKRLATWPVGTPVRFTGLMKDLARDVIMSVVFGVTDPERRRALEQAMIRLDRATSSAGMMSRYGLSMVSRGRWLPFPELDAAIDAVDQVVHDEVAFRRAHSRSAAAADVMEAKDCLSIFLRIQQEEGEGGFLDDEMLAAFMRLLLLAGHETTATTLAWTAERFVRHPAVIAKLDATLAGGDESYLDAVITEAMRVRPAIPVTVRSVVKDCVMNNLILPEGTVVVVYVNAIHKRGDLYPEPERFDPERFVGNRPDPRHWMPFGGGAHYCLGAQLSMVESRVLLRTILEEHRFVPETSPDERQVQHRSIMTLPGDGARVTLLRR
jgi:cytochrome P450